MDAAVLRQKAQQKYLEHNFILVKLRPNSKIPMERNWTQLPFRSKFKCNGNYGVVLQHDHIIVDVDPRNFKKGQNSFQKLKDDIGGLPQTFVVRTGAGGFHYYYRKPASLVCKKSIKEYPGIEFKTKGSQIVAPGSVHPETKKLYLPHNKSKIRDIVDAPIGLLNVLTETHEKSGAPRHRNFKYTDNEATITRYLHYLKIVDGAVEGQGGDEATFKVAAF